MDLSRWLDAERGWVSAEIYHDRELYELELERIFGRAWLFLGHDTMLPEVGDFIQTYMGEDPVLVVRQKDGSVQAFLNQCRHRGMRICRADVGTARAFTCSYHGWSYDIGGGLVSVPNEELAYETGVDRAEWSAVRVAQIANHKGFLFATWDPEAPPFHEYLGEMAFYLDAYIDRFDGGLEFIGEIRSVMHCNWKFPAEQFASDQMHVKITHASTLSVLLDTLPGALEHLQLDVPREGRQYSSPKGHGTTFFFNEPTGLSPWEQQNDQAASRLGPAAAAISPGHGTLFPNCSFLAGPFNVWQPKGPDETEIHLLLFVPASAPAEAKAAIRAAHTSTLGPAGTVEQDDGENWNEIQKVLRGHKARTTRWNLAAGRTVRHDAEGLPGRTTPTPYSEFAARGFYARWRDMLRASTWAELAELERAAVAAEEPIRPGTAR